MFHNHIAKTGNVIVLYILIFKILKRGREALVYALMTTPSKQIQIVYNYIQTLTTKEYLNTYVNVINHKLPIYCCKYNLGGKHILKGPVQYDGIKSQ